MSVGLPVNAGPALELRQATRRFGRRWALRGITLRVQPGEVVVVTGANGSGKSTLLRVAASAVTLTSGDGWVFGHSVRRDGRMVRPLVGLLGHSPGLYEDLTVSENLEFAGKMLALPDVSGDVCRAMAATGLAPHAAERVKTLSSGWQKRVALARLHMQSPMLLLLDEPYNSFDAEGVEVVNTLIESTRQRGGAALVVTHSLVQATGVLDRCLSLRAGVLVDEPAQIRPSRTGSTDEAASPLPRERGIEAALLGAERS